MLVTYAIGRYRNLRFTAHPSKRPTVIEAMTTADGCSSMHRSAAGHSPEAESGVRVMRSFRRGSVGSVSRE